MAKFKHWERQEEMKHDVVLPFQCCLLAITVMHETHKIKFKNNLTNEMSVKPTSSGL